jgi:hypothetical protein
VIHNHCYGGDILNCNQATFLIMKENMFYQSMDTTEPNIFKHLCMLDRETQQLYMKENQCVFITNFFNLFWILGKTQSNYVNN